MNSGMWRNPTSSMVATNVCFQTVAKLIATAGMRRIAGIHHAQGKSRIGVTDDLGNWSQVERQLIEELGKKIVIEDEEGRPQAITRSAIEGAYRWLVKKTDLDSRFAKPPTL